VAQSKKQGQESSQTGYVAPCRHLCGDKPQRPVTAIRNAGNANGNDQRLAQGTRTSICQRAAGAHLLPGCGVLSATKDLLCEPPGADPHARWRGDWGRKTSGCPIRCYSDSKYDLLRIENSSCEYLNSFVIFSKVLSNLSDSTLSILKTSLSKNFHPWLFKLPFSSS
jgi:hypothetical protein